MGPRAVQIHDGSVLEIIIRLGRRFPFPLGVRTYHRIFSILRADHPAHWYLELWDPGSDHLRLWTSYNSSISPHFFVASPSTYFLHYLCFHSVSLLRLKFASQFSYARVAMHHNSLPKSMCSMSSPIKWDTVHPN